MIIQSFTGNMLLELFSLLYMSMALLLLEVILQVSLLLCLSYILSFIEKTSDNLNTSRE